MDNFRTAVVELNNYDVKAKQYFILLFRLVELKCKTLQTN